MKRQERTDDRAQGWLAKAKAYAAEKNVQISARRYGVDAMGAMAQGLFASLLIGTILNTAGTQLGLELLTQMGGYASAVAGPAMAVSIGFALNAPALVLFSLITVGQAANSLAARAARWRCSSSPSWPARRASWSPRRQRWISWSPPS